MNPITLPVKIGTIGELLVTLRLLQYGVQAAPPLKDSGNDLIAVRHKAFRALHVKTTTTNRFNHLEDLPNRLYHYVAFVHLVQAGEVFDIKESRIFLVEDYLITQASYGVEHFVDLELSQELINKLFAIDDEEFEIEFLDELNAPI
jgi:hypothetical protein